MIYNVNTFPDGQINVSIRKEFSTNLRFSIKSYKDIAILASIAESHYYQYGYMPDVDIPFMFGQRSDRRFAENESIGLKIVAQMINSIGLSRVSILDPHSHDTITAINNSRIWSPNAYIYKAWFNFCERNLAGITGSLLYENVLVSPDAGAYKKVEKLGQDFLANTIPGNKSRDNKGNIKLSFEGDVRGKNLFIVDDLADGGATFHYLAKKAKELGANKVALYVTHGMFMKGLNGLDEYIDVIYTTDSYRNDFDSIQPKNNKNFFQVQKVAE